MDTTNSTMAAEDHRVGGGGNGGGGGDNGTAKNFITKLDWYDVWCGRVSERNRHPGNVHLHQTIHSYQGDYAATKDVKRKQEIVADIIDSVVQNNGRFLLQVESSSPQGDLNRGPMAWVLMEESMIIDSIHKVLCKNRRDSGTSRGASVTSRIPTEPDCVVSQFSGRSPALDQGMQDMENEADPASTRIHDEQAMTDSASRTVPISPLFDSQSPMAGTAASKAAPNGALAATHGHTANRRQRTLYKETVTGRRVSETYPVSDTIQDQSNEGAHSGGAETNSNVLSPSPNETTVITGTTIPIVTAAPNSAAVDTRSVAVTAGTTSAAITRQGSANTGPGATTNSSPRHCTPTPNAAEQAFASLARNAHDAHQQLQAVKLRCLELRDTLGQLYVDRDQVLDRLYQSYPFKDTISDSAPDSVRGHPIATRAYPDLADVVVMPPLDVDNRWDAFGAYMEQATRKMNEFRQMETILIADVQQAKASLTKVVEVYDNWQQEYATWKAQVADGFQAVKRKLSEL